MAYRERVGLTYPAIDLRNVIGWAREHRRNYWTWLVRVTAPNPNQQTSPGAR
jgi:hypothetical protein